MPERAAPSVTRLLAELHAHRLTNLAPAAEPVTDAVRALVKLPA
jgi:hypothetical protein